MLAHETDLLAIFFFLLPVRDVGVVRSVLSRVMSDKESCLGRCQRSVCAGLCALVCRSVYCLFVILSCHCCCLGAYVHWTTHTEGARRKATMLRLLRAVNSPSCWLRRLVKAYNWGGRDQDDCVGVLVRCWSWSASRCACEYQPVTNSSLRQLLGLPLLRATDESVEAVRTEFWKLIFGFPRTGTQVIFLELANRAKDHAINNSESHCHRPCTVAVNMGEVSQTVCLRVSASHKLEPSTTTRVAVAPCYRWVCWSCENRVLKSDSGYPKDKDASYIFGIGPEWKIMLSTTRKATAKGRALSRWTWEKCHRHFRFFCGETPTLSPRTQGTASDDGPLPTQA